MRRVRAIACRAVAAVVLALAAWGAPAACAAEPRDDPPGPGILAKVDPDIGSSLVNRVEARWWRTRALGAADQGGAARDAARDLLSYLREEGVGRADVMADAAVAGAQADERAGKLDEAAAAYRLALGLDPHCAAAHWGLGRLAWRTGQGTGATLRLFAAALAARARDVWSVYGVGLALLAWAAVALGATAAGFVVFEMVWHGPELAHEVGERLPLHWHAAWRDTIGYAVVLAPLALPLLGPWCLAVWAAVLPLAVSRAERRALYVGLIVLALAVPASGAVWILTGVGASPMAREAVGAAERALRRDAVRELAALIDAHPENATARALLARLVAARHPDVAMGLLREAAAAAPRDARMRVLLGNVLYRIGKFEAAGVEYRAAAVLDPRSAVPPFNLSRVRLKTLAFDGAAEAGRQARGADAGEYARLERVVAEGEVADPVFGAREVAWQVLSEEVRPGLAAALEPANPATIGALAALLIAFALRVRIGSIGSRRCPHCGRPHCPRCPGRVREAEVCPRCDQLLGRREGLDPKAREEQRARIERWSARRARGGLLLHVAWPGMALVPEGRVATGLALAAAWAFLVLSAAFPESLLPAGTNFSPWPPGRAALVAAIVFWLLVQCPPWRPRSAAAER